jgi:protein-L-isoaspartate(D-aspartate) O-methyltransferase
VHDEQPEQASLRRRMVETVQAEIAATAGCTGIRELSPPVRRALGAVPRHLFVPESLRDLAYADRPVSIGAGQTISQPFIVALMTELSGAGPQSRVLEVGTGSGYQAAVLAALGAIVFTVESVPELAQSARERLQHLGYSGIEVRAGDGSRGWPEHAPFDAIVVTAAAPAGVETALLEQLAAGGRMVIPVDREGTRNRLFGAIQELMVYARDEQGDVEERAVLPVAFVPLIPRPSGH